MIEALLRELQVATGGALSGRHVFVPHLQVGDVGVEVDAATRFSRTLQALQEARVVIAVLDGPQVDDEVAFLLGYAFAAEKPVVGYVTDARGKNAVVEAACTAIAHDVRALAAMLPPLLR